MLCRIINNKVSEFQNEIQLNVPKTDFKSNFQTTQTKNKNQETYNIPNIISRKIKHISPEIQINNILKTQDNNQDESTNSNCFKKMNNFYNSNFVSYCRNRSNKNLHPRIINIVNNNNSSNKHIQNLKLVCKSYSREKKINNIKDGGENLKTKMKNNQKINPVNISNDSKINCTEIYTSKCDENNENENIIRGDYSIEMKESDELDSKKKTTIKITASMLEESIEKDIEIDIEKKIEKKANYFENITKKKYLFNPITKNTNVKAKKFNLNFERGLSNNIDKLLNKNNTKYKQLNIVMNIHYNKTDNSFNNHYIKKNNTNNQNFNKKDSIIKLKTGELNIQKKNFIKNKKNINNNKTINKKTNKNLERQKRRNEFILGNTIPILNNSKYINSYLKTENDESLEFPYFNVLDKCLPISKKSKGRTIKTKYSPNNRNFVSPTLYYRTTKHFLSNSKTIKNYLTVENILEKNKKKKPQENNNHFKKNSSKNNAIYFNNSNNELEKRKENNSYSKTTNLQNVNDGQKIFKQKGLIKNNNFKFNTFNSQNFNSNKINKNKSRQIVIFSKKGTIKKSNKQNKMIRKTTKKDNISPNIIGNKKKKINKHLFTTEFKNKKNSDKKNLEYYIHQQYINGKNYSYSERCKKQLSSYNKNKMENSTNALNQKKRQCNNELELKMNNIHPKKHNILKNKIQEIQKKEQEHNIYKSSILKTNINNINNISVYKKLKINCKGKIISGINTYNNDDTKNFISDKDESSGCNTYFTEKEKNKINLVRKINRNVNLKTIRSSNVSSKENNKHEKIISDPTIEPDSTIQNGSSKSFNFDSINSIISIPTLRDYKISNEDLSNNLYFKAIQLMKKVNK